MCEKTLRTTLRLSDPDIFQSKDRALRVIAADAFLLLKDRKAPRADKEGAVLSTMAIDWATALAKAVGFEPMNGFL